ncbi:hypothetical protein ABT299_43175 [Spirillospora sp. NPDC000708]
MLTSKNHARINELLDQLAGVFDVESRDSLLRGFRRLQNSVGTGMDCTEDARSLAGSLRSTAALVDALRQVTCPATSACGCAESARIVVSGVTVAGHHVACQHSEPRIYHWRAGEHLTLGTLADYARAWEVSAYDDSRAELGTELRTAHEAYMLSIESRGADDQDYMHYRLAVGNESVEVRIDGRA